jgi:hypothetical protein
LEDKPIKVFNNGNMPVPWNAKQIPPGLSRGRVSVHWGVRDFTYIDDIVEGVVRVIDTPPAPGPLDARVPDSVTPNFQERSELKVKGRTNPDENLEGGTTDAAPSPQHNATSGPHEHSTDASQSSPFGGVRGGFLLLSLPLGEVRWGFFLSLPFGEDRWGFFLPSPLGGIEGGFLSPPLEGLGEAPNKT